MTHITIKVRQKRRLLRRIWALLPGLNRRPKMTRLDTWPDHMLRDIGAMRDPIDAMATRCLPDAMRYPG